MSIPRGVTPTFSLEFADENLDLTEAEHVYVTFRSSGTLTKSDGELTVAAKAIQVYLSQAETLAFRQGPVQIQANWVYSDGTRGASTVAACDFSAQLLDEVVP